MTLELIDTPVGPLSQEHLDDALEAGDLVLTTWFEATYQTLPIQAVEDPS